MPECQWIILEDHRLHCPVCGYTTPEPEYGRRLRDCRPFVVRGKVLPVYGPPRPDRKGPCQHRGDVVGTLPCGVCERRGVEIKVFACELHGHCTLDLVRVPMGQAAPKLCTRCNDHDPPPAG